MPIGMLAGSFSYSAKHIPQVDVCYVSAVTGQRAATQATSPHAAISRHHGHTRTEDAAHTRLYQGTRKDSPH